MVDGIRRRRWVISVFAVAVLSLFYFIEKFEAHRLAAKGQILPKE